MEIVNPNSISTKKNALSLLHIGTVHFKHKYLSLTEIINILNGKNWDILCKYAMTATQYRGLILNEFEKTVYYFFFYFFF